MYIPRIWKRVVEHDRPQFEFNVGLAVFYIFVILVAAVLLVKKQIYLREFTAILSVVAVGWLYAVYLFALVSKRKSLEAVVLTMEPDLASKLNKLRNHEFDSWFGRFLIDLKSSQNDLLLYKKIFFHADEAVLLLDNEFNVVSANAMAQEMLERKMLIGANFWNFFSGTMQDDFKVDVMNALGNVGEFVGEATARKLSMRAIPVHIRMQKENNAEGVARNYLVYITDISVNKQLQQELQYLAEYDPLTHLPNRALFVANLMKRFDEPHAGKMLIFVADIDNFKVVNDAYGHAVGDNLLKILSQRLLTLVPERNQVARLSGNEFAILIDEVEGVEAEGFIAKKIIEVFNEPVIVGTREFSVSIGLGMCVFPDDGRNVEQLIMNAASACFHAKRRARNFWLRYVENMNSDSTYKHELEQDLRKAILEDTLEVYYQPIIDLKTGSIAGLEALLRWHHPERGDISPVEFIPLAEETGLIATLGQWVLRRACEQAKIWQSISPIYVSVNVSSYQFKTYDIAEVVADVLWETGLDAKSLQLELVESLVLENSQKSAMTMRVLKTMGVSIAIDDFGTGYASLSYIRNFPIQCVKIDQSFVAGMLHNPEDSAIVKAIIEMAHTLNLNVVAEGVETEAHLNRLIHDGADEIQGFYFSKALPADEVGPLLRSNAHALSMKKKEAV